MADPRGEGMSTDHRIALCHEWLTTYGGSEQVAQRIAAALDIKDVYTFTMWPETARSLFPDSDVKSLPRGGNRLAREHWQWMLPVMPGAWSKLDLSDHDVVFTSSHACVNAIRVRPGAKHISYCHTPMRYAWEWRSEIGRIPAPLRPAWPALASRLRRADKRWSQNVDLFLANSNYVARRIRSAYGRAAVVVYPPVDTSYWTPSSSARGDYFLLAGRQVAYKRPEIAVRAANRTRLSLVVAGGGPEMERLRAIAGPTVTFVEDPERDRLRDLYRAARALVVPGVEDFGMTLVESQACGTPVIARAEGGALEAVRGGRTGTLYHGASADDLADAMEAFDETGFDQANLVEHAAR
ncbi:MAG TPA: glycosyltransferase, partial [Actinomycetota bacterium]|nr:glycosyltransferase [Actinomycetota bacterium]